MSAPADSKSNRLIGEKSPYLLQHATNPVDWYPWGEEAFRRAREEDKPIFLSIGYSTCHWCHVMERESFVDSAVAGILNEHFISIKVDREERPDIDQIYMQAVMAISGSGGWPMSVFLTPERKPFYGGTYFPPEDRWGRPGFKTLLRAIDGKWKSERSNLTETADSLVSALSSGMSAEVKTESTPGAGLLTQAYQQFAMEFDGEYGGFSDAPKFPRPPILNFLLRVWKRTGDAEALRMTELTLEKMADGGMNDQLGGGFHRYSTDPIWQVPHFEKMLYDQALLALAYLETYQATGKTRYAETAREIFEYVLRDMTGPEGGFYSAEDADSAEDPADLHDKKEGAFYVWSQGEIRKLLGPEGSTLFEYVFGVKEQGNAYQDPHGEFHGKNILHRFHADEDAAKEFGLSEEKVRPLLNESKKILFEARAKRVRPHLDDKILADWNGLMIGAFALGGRVLDEPRYAQAAQKSADFILSRMQSGNKRLLHRYRAGEAAIPGFLDDYAFLAGGLLELYQTCLDARYLAEAARLTNEMLRLFWDEKGGGFFFSAGDAETLIARPKEVYDGAVPSGNSEAAGVLLRLARMLVRSGYEEKSQILFRTFAETIEQHPSGFPLMLTALDFALGPSREIVIAGEGQSQAFKELSRAVHADFFPNQVVLYHPADSAKGDEIRKLAGYLKDYKPLGGKPAVYVCRNYHCELPVTDVNELRKLLTKYGTH